MNRSEPIAIVGIGCRFPGGGDSPASFWRTLLGDVDAIVDVPPDRWDVRRHNSRDVTRPGKSYAYQGGFLQEDILAFDPMFFGISPREAACMDPQQRLLLEVSWEAMEDAGLPVEILQACNTGVFIGGFTLDNMLLQLDPANRHLIDAHTPTSGSMAVLANRISHIFDLTGPSIAMDTACSSSLVATHLACQSLLTGGSDVALVGGVNVMLLPGYPVSMSKGRFLSEHARCKAFDADAAGYTRGEGAGIVVLKPLSKALENHDRVYAVIGGTGVNQDGSTVGMASPNSAAQESLMRSVYARAGVDPSEIQFFEAHGTGTQAGDTAEVQSLQRVLSEGRADDDPCLVGSVKTRIGHLEASAGVAALIKTALCIHHGEVPPNLHLTTPNPTLNLDSSCLEVVTERTPWPDTTRRVAGINSFGYGGTNAHAVLWQTPDQTEQNVHDTPGSPRTPSVFPLTALDETALRARAGQLASWLDQPHSPSLDNLCHNAARRREHLPSRLSVSAPDLDTLKERLRRVALDLPTPGVEIATTHHENAPSLVFVYTGMGPQWAGMGRALRDTEPVFAGALARLDAHVEQVAGWSVADALDGLREAEGPMPTQIAQPANLLIQMALTELLAHQGVRPAAVVGHSVGEVAAAWAAGVLSDRDAIRVIFHRSRLQASVANANATMLAVGCSLDALGPLPTGVDIAALNSPESVTLAGSRAALSPVAEMLEPRGVFHRFLSVEVAYHSAEMDPIREELLTSLSSIATRPAALPLYSTVTASRLDEGGFDASYWWSNVRKPVRFSDTIEALHADGYSHFVEVGPHPVLRHAIRDTLAGQSVEVLSTLHRKEEELEAWASCLGRLFVHGVELSWPDLRADVVRAWPSYPWQRQRCWRESEASRRQRVGDEGSVFLYDERPSAFSRWEVELNEQFFPFLHDHRVQGQVVFPGAGYVCAGLDVHHAVYEQGPCMMEQLRFEAPLIYDAGQVSMLSTEHDPTTNTFSIHSHGEGDEQTWSRHMTGRLRPDGICLPPPLELSELRARFDAVDPSSITRAMQEFSDRGLHYRGSFACLRALWRREDTALARLETAPTPDTQLLHPATLDGAFQLLLTIVGNPGLTYVPASIEELEFYRPASAECWAYGEITHREQDSVHGDLWIFDEDGALVLTVRGLQCRALARPSKPTLDGLLYERLWTHVDAPPDDPAPRSGPHLVVLSEDEAPPSALLEGMNSDAVTTFSALASDTLETLRPTQITCIWPASSQKRPCEVASQVTCQLVHLLACLRGAQLANTQLTLLTQQAQVVTDRDLAPAFGAAPVWAVARVAQNEHPDLSVRLVDLDTSPDSLRSFLDDTRRGGVPDLVAYRDGTRWTRRLMPSEPITHAPITRRVCMDEVAVALAQRQAGDPASLHHRVTERVAPATGEVELRVHASALNFKDLLKVYAQLDADITRGTYLGASAGSELTGRVTRVGEGVDHVRVGDEVITTEPGAFRSFITVPSTFVVPRPSTLNPHQAPVMVNFLTAYHGLHELARLQPGERVLIHNASGGVGLAAIQVARWKQAEVFATAGTEEKRAHLREMGVEHVHDSRSLRFAEEIRRTTGRHGVDVVLSAQADDFMVQSFRLLAPYGRYIEIGKKNISSDSGLPMRAFNRSLTFSAFDLDHMFAERPAHVKRLLSELHDLFEAEILTPIPVTVFPADEVADAFKFLARSQHIGKVVVSYEGDANAREEPPTVALQPDGVYLITGGTRGFGLAVAEHLLHLGARRLVLLSRSGMAREHTEREVTRLREQGADIRVVAMDVSDGQAIRAFVQELSASGVPLRGVVHSAMVLDDGLLADLDDTRVERVMAPKAVGAWNLHEACEDVPLDFFVCFSSVSSWVGNAGQGSYVAANSFLDALAEHRRAKGLPATTLNWGALAEVGVVSRDARIQEALDHAGIRPLSLEASLSAVTYALEHQPAQVGVFDVDWAQWSAASPTLSTLAEFEQVSAATGAQEPQRDALTEALLAMPPQERLVHVESILLESLAQVLRCAVEQLSAQQSVKALGVDSLTAVELSSILKERTGMDVTAVSLLSEWSITRQCQKILDALITEEDELLSRLEDLSEEELDALLAEED